MDTQASARVLVVEDESKLAALLMDYLAAAGHVPTWINDGAKALALLRAQPFDAVLLDVSLPGMDGLAVCRSVRETSDLPVLMITARVEEVDRLVGLEAGADDYVCKPFSVRELVARVKVILRRPRISTRDSGLVVDAERHQATLDGKALDLTPVEFRLLATLAAAPGKVLSREKLLAQLYEDHRVVTGRTVDTHVKNLRRKLGEARPGADLLRSIYGVGYALETA